MAEEQAEVAEETEALEDSEAEAGATEAIEDQLHHLEVIPEEVVQNWGTMCSPTTRRVLQIKPRRH